MPRKKPPIKKADAHAERSVPELIEESRQLREQAAEVVAKMKQLAAEVSKAASGPSGRNDRAGSNSLADDRDNRATLVGCNLR
jgi:hypothetical protein